MASTVTVNPRLRKLLRKLPEDVKKGVRDEYDEAAEVLRYEILVRVPEREGELARSIGTRRGAKGTYVDVGPGLAGPTKERQINRAKARWIEYGTKGHKVKTQLRKVLSDEEEFFGQEIQHPGTPPHPFLKPALEAARPQIKEKLREAVSRAVRAYVQSHS